MYQIVPHTHVFTAIRISTELMIGCPFFDVSQSAIIQMLNVKISFSPQMYTNKNRHAWNKVKIIHDTHTLRLHICTPNVQTANFV